MIPREEGSSQVPTYLPTYVADIKNWSLKAEM